MKTYQHINESIIEKQSVQFIIDSTPELNFINNMDLSCFQKGIVFCDKKLSFNWWPKILSKIQNSISIKDVSFLDASEQTKSIEKFVDLINYLGKVKCTKNDVIIVIGGGTILDVISFIASTFMRGIPLIMIPTTLIGQADASTAGKTCINTNYGKNILGTLYLPIYVYNNVQILKTNSAYEYRQGFSEIFKYGLLGSKKLIDLQVDYKNNQTDKLMMEIIAETINVRMHIRKKDPLASNLGHTFGHAIEKITNYAVNHGDAISVGIVMALEFGVTEGIIAKDQKDKIIKIMKELKLNTQLSDDLDVDFLNEAMLTDKKSSNTHIRLVLIRDIAMPYKSDDSHFYSVRPEKMIIFLKNFIKKGDYISSNHWESLKKDET